MQYSTELLEAKWLDKEGEWELKLRNVAAENPEDAVYTVRHTVVILACGPPSQVRMPQGIDRDVFKGTQFHSAHWRHDVALGMASQQISLRVQANLAYRGQESRRRWQWVLSYTIPANRKHPNVRNGPVHVLTVDAQIARKTKSLTQYISSPQWYVPRDNPLYTDLEKAAFRFVPGAMQFHRWRIAYNWESNAANLQDDEKGTQRRKVAEGYLLSYMKSVAPEKYHEQLTPNYPVS